MRIYSYDPKRPFPFLRYFGISVMILVITVILYFELTTPENSEFSVDPIECFGVDVKRKYRKACKKWMEGDEDY